MPAKKPVKKSGAAKVETKVKAFAKSVEKEAKTVQKSSEELGSKIGSRRHVASTEEKIYTIIGILLLIRGLYVLKGLVRGMLLIVVGILFATGFFTRRHKK